MIDFIHQAQPEDEIKYKTTDSEESTEQAKSTHKFDFDMDFEV